MAMPPVHVSDAPLAHRRWAGRGAAARADAPPILLLHGVGGGSQAWLGVAPWLAAAGHTVLAVDAPGYGDSASIDPHDLAGMAGAVGALIAASGHASARLVGHSMGGMIAQELAARAPQQVAGLVLASTSPAFGKPGGDWQRAFLQSRFAPLDAGLGMPQLAEQLVPTMLGPLALDDPQGQACAFATGVMAAVPEATYRAAVTALVAFDQRANLPNLAMPTLVITGEADRTAPPEVARRMAERITGARLRIVPGAGHLLPMELPEVFAAELLSLWPAP